MVKKKCSEDNISKKLFMMFDVQDKTYVRFFSYTYTECGFINIFCNSKLKA